MQSAFAIALLGAVALAKSDNGLGKGANGEDFLEYIAENNKTYKDREDFTVRKANWLKSTQDIKELREKNPNAQFGLNKWSDWSDEEFNAKMLGLQVDDERRELDDVAFNPENNRELQSLQAIDWRTSGNLPGVKDQGSCGSCWAFNASVVLETMDSIKKSASAGSLVAPRRVSEQEGVDCVYSRDGCQGGWPTDYWAMTAARYGLTSTPGAQWEDDYPYTATYSNRCNENAGIKTSDNPRAASWGRVSYSTSGVHALLEDAPLSVALAAGNTVWRNYQGGIVTPSSGCPTRLDHAVVLVAFTPGQEVPVEAVPEQCRSARNNEKKRNRCRGGLTFKSDQCCMEGSPATTRQEGATWTIRNSWGEDWGENGDMRLEVTDSGYGVCGMNNYIDAMTIV